MTCKSCEKRIEEGLSEIDGVGAVNASFPEENVEVSFDETRTDKYQIVDALEKLGYPLGDRVNGKKSSSLKEGIIYGLVPHIGCIGFIIASILGVTIAVEFFKPLLMNPWFFHILIALSFGFATLSSIIYLKKNGVLSFNGVKRKKVYLATMYGATIGINLILFLFIFPMLANLDTGSFATGSAATGVITASGNGTVEVTQLQGNIMVLAVDIPCPGHASLITNEIKTIDGVKGVKFDFPNLFSVNFTGDKEEILALDVFNTYPATVVSEDLVGDGTSSASLGLESDSIEVATEQTDSGASGVTKVTKTTASNTASVGSCGGGCGTPACNGSCGSPTCGGS